jgi:hypothetical protein
VASTAWNDNEKVLKIAGWCACIQVSSVRRGGVWVWSVFGPLGCGEAIGQEKVQVARERGVALLRATTYFSNIWVHIAKDIPVINVRISINTYINAYINIPTILFLD